MDAVEDDALQLVFRAKVVVRGYVGYLGGFGLLFCDAIA